MPVLLAQVTNGKLASLEVQLGSLQRCFSVVQIDEADEILYAASSSSGDVATVRPIRGPYCLPAAGHDPTAQLHPVCLPTQ